ncbi:MAG: hypothetical protein Q9209_003927 [Squamulea sp. 1 TL-2023]
MRPFPDPTTLFSLLVLINLAAAGSLTLSDKPGGGCHFKFDDVCGCSKTVVLDPSESCDQIRGKIHGGVCRGSWRLDASLPLDKRIGLSFDNRKDCKQRCIIMGGRNSCEGKDYENDADLKQSLASSQDVPFMVDDMPAAPQLVRTTLERACSAGMKPGENDPDKACVPEDTLPRPSPDGMVADTAHQRAPCGPAPSMPKPCPASMMRGPNNPETCVPDAGPPQSPNGPQDIPPATHMMPEHMMAEHMMPEHRMPDNMMPGASRPPHNNPETSNPKPIINDIQNSQTQYGGGPSEYPGLAQNGCKPQRVRKLACKPTSKQCYVDVICCDAGCDPAITARSAFGDAADGTFVVEDLPVVKKSGEGVDVDLLGRYNSY